MYSENIFKLTKKIRFRIQFVFFVEYFSLGAINSISAISPGRCPGLLLLPLQGLKTHKLTTLKLHLQKKQLNNMLNCFF
ncbi:MAG TPA: hypothetical protein DCQ31_17975 [Bacteroidales bacterium]|nr:hypothetical protein [Bacteroidales bacterium]